jgi:hypothetical protein
MGVAAETLAVSQVVERRGNAELTRCKLVDALDLSPTKC